MSVFYLQEGLLPMELDQSSVSENFTQLGMPTHQQLVVPVIQAVVDLGGSAKSKEIVEHVYEGYPLSDELLNATYPNRDDLPVLADRIAWARSTAKLIGALEQPTRGLYLTTDFGENLLKMQEDAALRLIRDRERDYNREQRRKKTTESVAPDEGVSVTENHVDERLTDDVEATEIDDDWKAQLLTRLHRLSPDGFEKFVIFLLRKYGLELTHVGGSGDEGIDGIGTAPLSDVLSSRVAVQVKRYAPGGTPIGRETVALFQRDAQTKGAERAILVTLGRFTEPARKAATSATPTVDLINGDRLAELILKDGESGVMMQPKVNEAWFNRFD